MTNEEIKTILEEHQKWVCDNNTGKCADLSGVDLSGFNLSRMRLNRANLKGANLSRVDATFTNFYGANLTRVNFTDADLRMASQRTHGEHCLVTMEWLENRGLEADYLPEPDGPITYDILVVDELPVYDNAKPSYC